MDVFDLVAKITLDSSEYEKQVSDLADNADKNSGWGGKIMGGLGKIGKVGGLAFGAISAAATAAVTVIGKTALEGYAEYEQLSGGVQKLFGEQASKQVMKYAENAYKTAGMSANEYMETATSFSASLISSLGGDTAKAADVADIAMRSMSDNVNTFGGDIENVKNAYQGFAKQNYTMLDNLKLGYGGTKSEMERLIKDANKYRKAQGKNADLTVDSFADIVEAIQTVQEEQGIAGTTAKEAMTTIEGSATATKSAWKNVLTAIAGGGDLKQAMKGLTTSLFGAKEGEGLINQVIPRIKAIMEGLADFIGQAAPLFIAKIPELVSALLPSLITAAGSLVKAVVAALPGLLKGIWDAIKAAAPALIDAVKGIATSLPAALGSIISGIGGWISENAGTLLEKGKEIWEAIKNGIVTALSTIGETLMGLLSGITTWVTTNYDSIAQAGKNILSYIVEGIVTVASDIATGMLALIAAAGSWIINNSGTILSTGKTIVTYIINGIVEAVKLIGNGFVNLVSNIAQWVTDHSEEILAVGTSILDWIVSGISDFIDKIKDGFNGMVGKIKEKVEGVATALANVGLTILLKIKNGIKDNLEKIKDGFTGMLGKIREKITSMAEGLKGIGGTIVSKIVSGITGLADKIKEKIQTALTTIAEHTFIFKPKVNTDTGKVTAGAYSGHNSEYAKARNAPYLFTKGTVFGRYNGENLIAGEAGPEMLLGVNKLNAMLFQSVQGGMQSMMGQIYDMMSGMQTGGGGNAILEAQILEVLNRYLPGIADRQVVLDTGALAGAVAPGVNAALGTQVGNRRRYNA